jgi:hypothetical protein
MKKDGIFGSVEIKDDPEIWVNRACPPGCRGLSPAPPDTILVPREKLSVEGIGNAIEKAAEDFLEGLALEAVHQDSWKEFMAARLLAYLEGSK